MANKPNNPSLWSRAKSMARQKFDVYPCVPMDSQALTKEGWKYYHELQIGEEILAHNIEKNINEWTPIIALQKFEDAPIIRIYKKQTNFDIKCTPNHKWVLDEPNSKYSDNLVEAKDITKRMKIRTSAILGNDNEPLDLITFFKKDNWVKNILKMAISQVQSFFASGIVYDGNDKGLTGDGKKQTYGFSQKDIDHGLAMEIAATLLGYRVCSVPKKQNPSMKTWTFIRRSYESTQNIHKEDAGTADVWCPTTKFGTWVMKQNGYVTITGNSAYANGWAAKYYKSKGGTWRKGEQGMYMKDGGKVSVKAGGENHIIYKKQTKRGEGKVGNIMVNHPTMDKGKWDTIDLTQKAGAKTVAQGVAATKKWHKENPYPKKKMQMGGMTPAQKAAKKLAMNMKGKVVGSDRMLKSGGMFAQSGMAKPIYTSNPNDPRIRRFNDSLSLNNLTRMYEPMFMRNPYDERLWTYNTTADRIASRAGIKPTRVRTEDNEYAVGRDFEPRLMEQAYLAKFKRPVQPVKYADPKIVEKQKILKDAGLYSGDLDGIWGPKSEEAFKKYEESKATPSSTTSRETAPATPPTPVIKGSAAINKTFYNMTPEERQKAVKKYGSPKTWPFQGVDVRGFKKGGKTSKLKQAYFNKYK